MYTNTHSSHILTNLHTYKHPCTEIHIPSHTPIHTHKHKHACHMFSNSLTQTHTHTHIHTLTLILSPTLHTYTHTYLHPHILQRLVGGPERCFTCSRSHSTTGTRMEPYPKVTIPIRATMLLLAGQVYLGASKMIPVCCLPATNARTHHQLGTFLDFYSVRTDLPGCTASERNATDSQGKQSFADTTLSSQGIRVDLPRPGILSS